MKKKTLTYALYCALIFAGYLVGFQAGKYPISRDKVVIDDFYILRKKYENHNVLVIGARDSKAAVSIILTPDKKLISLISCRDTTQKISSVSFDENGIINGANMQFVQPDGGTKKLIDPHFTGDWTDEDKWKEELIKKKGVPPPDYLRSLDAFREHIHGKDSAPSK